MQIEDKNLTVAQYSKIKQNVKRINKDDTQIDNINIYYEQRLTARALLLRNGKKIQVSTYAHIPQIIHNGVEYILANSIQAYQDKGEIGWYIVYNGRARPIGLHVEKQNNNLHFRLYSNKGALVKYCTRAKNNTNNLDVLYTSLVKPHNDIKLGLYWSNNKNDNLGGILEHKNGNTMLISPIETLIQTQDGYEIYHKIVHKEHKEWGFVDIAYSEEETIHAKLAMGIMGDVSRIKGKFGIPECNTKLSQGIEYDFRKYIVQQDNPTSRYQYRNSITNSMKLHEINITNSMKLNEINVPALPKQQENQNIIGSNKSMLYYNIYQQEVINNIMYDVFKAIDYKNGNGTKVGGALQLQL